MPSWQKSAFCYVGFHVRNIVHAWWSHVYNLQLLQELIDLNEIHGSWCAHLTVVSLTS